MRGLAANLTVGERVRFYRQRRGWSQEVFAGHVARTVDWVRKVENNKIEFDRLSVIKAAADVLDVSLGDLLGEPSLLDWTADSGMRTVPAVRNALMDYAQITGLPGAGTRGELPTLDALGDAVRESWDSYQFSRFGVVTRELPGLLAGAQHAVAEYDGDDRLRAYALLALTYQSAAMTLTKVGEQDLAWIASDRGLAAARQSGDPVVIGSLLRSVGHSLLATGQYAAAVRMTEQAGDYLRAELAASAAPRPAVVGGRQWGRSDLLSVSGTLYLTGSMAAARAEDRSAVTAFLGHSQDAARQLGRDDNRVWTSFGPTNVAIHRVATAAELGDMQVAADLGPRVDASPLPVERQVRHQLEVARALSAWNKRDEALAAVLAAEKLAPEQVKYHFLSRQLVLHWVRNQRGKPPYALLGLARRLHVV